MLPQIVEMTEVGSGVDLISRALGIGAEVVRDALHLHRTGKRPPGRIDGRRHQPRQPGKPFVPMYKQLAAEVDRRRKAGEGFDRLAREMKVSRPTVVRAYDFANRAEAAAAAREGRTPTTSLSFRSGVRSTQARPQRQHGRAAQVRPSFRSPTTAGRPHERRVTAAVERPEQEW
jgi:hypothetical protein